MVLCQPLFRSCEHSLHNVGYPKQSSRTTAVASHVCIPFVGKGDYSRHARTLLHGRGRLQSTDAFERDIRTEMSAEPPKCSNSHSTSKLKRRSYNGQKYDAPQRFLIEYMDGLPSDSENDFEGYIDLDEALEGTLHHAPSDAACPSLDINIHERATEFSHNTRFSGNPGVVLDTAGMTPLDFFHLFFDSRVKNVICDKTCRYASQYLEREKQHLESHPFACAHEWAKHPFQLQELDAFLALVIGMGICGYPTIR